MGGTGCNRRTKQRQGRRKGKRENKTKMEECKRVRVEDEKEKKAEREAGRGRVKGHVLLTKDGGRARPPAPNMRIFFFLFFLTSLRHSSLFILLISSFLKEFQFLPGRFYITS